MKIYKKNISKFLTLAFLILCMSWDITGIWLVNNFPLSIFFSIFIGCFMGIMDQHVDWTLI